MKQLMLGNAAIARGLYEAGCSFVSSYPGTPSTEITEEASAYKDDITCEWACNEKVALESAHGASLGGVRSACAMKHVGLNVAADPLFTISYQGLNAGLIVFVADDPGMHSSQNEQDSRHYAKASKVPMLEPADSAEAIAFVKKAYEISDKYNTPVFIKMCTRVAHSQSVVEISDRVNVPRVEYVKDPTKVMMTKNSRDAHVRVEQRTLDLIAMAESDDINRVEMGNTDIGIICDSTSYQYAKEVFGEDASVLKLGMVWPLPVNKIKDFASKVKKLYVIEELDPFIEEHCKSIGVDVIGKDIFPICGEFSQNLIRQLLGKDVPTGKKLEDDIPARPPVMCAGCPHRGIFYTLKKLKCMVYGDIGCYTLGAIAPLNAMDLNVCMGASCSGLHGFNKAIGAKAEQNSVGVIGDSTFIHSGITGITNIAYNGSNSTVIILDNSITGMTGHQQNPTTGKNIYGDPASAVDLEALCKAVGIKRVTVVDPYDLKAVEQTIKTELAAPEPSIIISRRPCVMIKGTVHKPSLKVETDKCKGCKACMQIGCPAIAFSDGKARIDETLCIGCEVCTQMCKFEALKGVQ